MADLDDLFKKRDKKKKQAKSKFSTLDTDEFAKHLEASTVKADEENEDQENIDKQAIISTNDQLDEEWKPFDSDENKDYSGLRINIQNWKVEDEDVENVGVKDDNEKKPACPWGAQQTQNKNDEIQSDENQQSSVQDTTENSVKPTTLVDSTNQIQSSERPDNQAAAVAATASSTNTEEADSTAASTAAHAYVPPHLRRKMQEQPIDGNNKSTVTASASAEPAGKYVPPSMRNKMAAVAAGGGLNTPSQMVTVGRKSNKSQPNINDNLEFPSLDAAVENSGEKMTNGNDKFDYPKKSARIESKSGNPNMIDLENKFTALSSNN